MWQIVQRRYDRPAVHLALIDLLGTVIEPGGVAKADRVRSRKQPEGRVRTNDFVLVEEGELAGDFQDALDHEHDVGAAGVIFVETECDIVLQCPRQDAVTEFRDLLTVLEDDRILADEVDTADMAIEVDAHARPVQARSHLLDMGRFARAVIARDHHTPVVGKACKNGESRVLVEHVVRVGIRHMRVRFRKSGHLQVDINAKNLADRHFHVGDGGKRIEGVHEFLFRGEAVGAFGSCGRSSELVI